MALLAECGVWRGAGYKHGTPSGVRRVAIAYQSLTAVFLRLPESVRAGRVQRYSLSAFASELSRRDRPGTRPDVQRLHRFLPVRRGPDHSGELRPVFDPREK